MGICAKEDKSSNKTWESDPELQGLNLQNISTYQYFICNHRYATSMNASQMENMDTSSDTETLETGSKSLNQCPVPRFWGAFVLVRREWGQHLDPLSMDDSPCRSRSTTFNYLTKHVMFQCHAHVVS